MVNNQYSKNQTVVLENVYFNLTGADGVGKDSIFSIILNQIKNYQYFREPGGTVEAEAIRKIILCISDIDRERYFKAALSLDILPLTREYIEKAYSIFKDMSDINLADNKTVGTMETYLYAASRNETSNRFVTPKLEEGFTVIGSRSVACSMAYQGNARNLGYKFVWDANKAALTQLPHFEIYLDISTEIAMKRISHRTEKQDRLDNESAEFHRKTREGYLTYYEKYCPYPVYLVDASGTIEENVEKVLNILKKYQKTTSNN